MILTIVAEMMTARISTRSRREAMDWGLVLASQGIEATIHFNEETGWELEVPENEFERARGVLRQYQAENRQWPWRQRIPGRSVLFDWGSVAWVVLICLFFWLQTHLATDIRTPGMMDTAAVSRGEWWRLFTATFLHADIGHLAMNASIGLVLLGLTMGSCGTGVGLLAAYLAGVGGNVVVWLIDPAGHRNLGASGMVMGCVGLLAMQSVPARIGNRHALKYALGGVLGGLMLLVLFGLDPASDVLAHVGGFASGLALGAILTQAPRLARSKIANIWAGITFCLLAIYPWWLALKEISR